jgi:hypothetical protein
MDYLYITRLTHIRWEPEPRGLYGRNHAVPITYRGVVNNWTRRVTEFYDIENLRAGDLRGFISLAWGCSRRFKRDHSLYEPPDQVYD